MHCALSNFGKAKDFGYVLHKKKKMHAESDEEYSQRRIEAYIYLVH
jgi:hypothetical protein